MNGEDLTCSPPEGRAAFSAVKALAFLPGAVLLGALVGGAAAVAQGWFAPLILFPLLVGVVLGAVLFILLRAMHTANRPTLVLGTVLAVAAAVLAEHYVSYRVTVTRQENNRQLQIARAAFGADLGRPVGFFNYLRQEARRGRTLFGGKAFGDVVARGRWVWATWAADGLLVLLGALAIVLPGLGFSYCRDCQSWYRTIRHGRLKRPFANRLAETVAVSLPEKAGTVRYRLLGCAAGCGPTGLELRWRRRRGEDHSTLVWLSPRGRDEVQHVLDEARASRTRPPPTDH